MWWQKDDLADQLIANNAARPRPGMEKPDIARLTISGLVSRRKTAAADKTSTDLAAIDGLDQPRI